MKKYRSSSTAFHDAQCKRKITGSGSRQEKRNLSSSPEEMNRFINEPDRKESDEELKKLSVAIRQSPLAVVITDPLGNIEYINPAFTRDMGYSLDEVKGQDFRIFQSGKMPADAYNDLLETLLSGGVWRGELHNKKKNGDLYWENALISAIRNDDGVITNFVAVKENITEKKKQWVELLAAKEKAETNDRLKSAFLANISHEIRTPMNGILGFSELLREPRLSGEKQAEYIDLIHQSGMRMLGIINDLLDISRIEAGETVLQISETPVNGLLRDLLAFFKPEAESKMLRLNCTEGLSDSESVIKTDSLRLSQILTNLVKNALKFTNTGGIDFGYTRKNTLLEFYVIDSGIGIPVDMKERIFERFHQADNAQTKGTEGAGLGLSISRELVAMLGGTIRVESEKGMGSTFFFTIPYNPESSPKFEQPSPIASGDQFKALSNLTILIAEDDEASSYLLKKCLKAENITTFSAVNGEEALRQVESHPEIGLVLMDIRMPEMNGIDATMQIKQHRPDFPIIALSAFASQEEREMARQSGCDGFITKPINMSELLELINELLNHSIPE